MARSICIADRDATERSGIRWFMQSYQMHFDQVFEVSHVDELLDILHSERPEVIFLELEMIPADRFATVQRYCRYQAQTVICLTAEAIFERAMQTIELRGISLLVKPLSPDQLKRTLLSASQSMTDQRKPAPAAAAAMEQDSWQLTYESFFIAHPWEYGTYSLLLIRPEKKDQLWSVFQWLKEYPLSYPSQTFALKEQVACVLHVPSENETALLQQEGHRLLHRFRNEHPDVYINVAVHPASFSSYSLQDMYVRTNDCFKLSFYQGHHQLFWVQDAPLFESIDPFLTPDEQKHWIALLEEGRKNEIKSWLYGLYAEGPPYPDPELIRVRLTSVLAQIRRFMQRYQLDEEADLEQQYHKIFQIILHQPILFRIVQEMILFVFAVIVGTEEKIQQTRGVIERAIHYIEKNYTQQGLKLDHVADHVGMSSNYLSALLSSKKGKPFRQILLELRMKEARRLLKETNLSIQEITHRIGYADPNYFSRVFKMETGLSPRAFRQQQTNDTQSL